MAGPGGGTLAERLRRLFPQASGRSRKQWLADGRVRVDGAVTREGRRPLAPGARVTLGPPAGRPRPLPFPVVLEDEHLVAIDKPPGLLTIAARPGPGRTAYRALWNYLAAGRPPGRPFVVHRLDRETSGLVVFAKSPQAQRRLQEQFARREAERVYLAVVEGRVREEQGTLTSRLAQDASLRVREVRRGRRRPRGAEGADRSREAGREAITHFRVLGRTADRTWLELRLGTGRRQQIRVQLAGLGHPVVGDLIHGARPAPRLLLHATRLGFRHPATGAPVRLQSRPPAVFGRPGA
jgi:23S rRNA pseudouridine1911/1915/1917 synthase